MDKQKKDDMKSNVKYQRLEDDSPRSSSSSTSSSQSNNKWFEKYIQRNKGPKYERLKEEKEEEKQSNIKKK